MPYGYTGKILHVDLSSGEFSVEEPPESFYRTYMGGSSFGLTYLLRETTAGTNPVSPANLLTFMLSVTTGAPVSGQSRMNVNARSPLTGAIGDSQAGGFFPAELKFAGFDGIVVRGRSPRPVYLTILHGQYALRDASHLADRTIAEVDAMLKAEVGDPKAEVMQHGPAAEHGVLFSSIVNMANRNAGRTGMGLVMASKNLRAIVVRGKQRVTVADPAALAALHKSGPKLMPQNPDIDGLGTFGTAGLMTPQNMNGTQPTFNYNEGRFDAAEAISGETMAATVLKGRDTCYSCVVRCKRVVEITEGPHRADPVYGGPEYETLSTLGSYCGIGDLAALCEAHQICDAYGVDSMSCGATIAFAMECFEKGIIGLKETGGIELRFGNVDAMLEVLQQIVTASGSLGPILAMGSARAARIWGPAAEECTITVKNQELPAHMPQAKRSLGLIYAVNPFGADHQSSEHDPVYEEGATPLHLQRLAELGLTTPQPWASLGPEKIRFAYLTQLFYSAAEALCLCQFVFNPAWGLYGPTELVAMVRAVTGWDVTLAELMKVGERRLNLLRTYNAREGLTRKDDRLPSKLFKPLRGTGPTAGVALDRDAFEAALDTYYELCGWTPDGLPTSDKLEELGIAWAASALPGAAWRVPGGFGVARVPEVVQDPGRERGRQ